VVGRPAKKPAHDVPKALRNYGKPKIPVFLMGGEDCTVLLVHHEHTTPAAASTSKVVRRAESEAAALASITPFARGTDSQQPVLYFTQPPETQLLVSASPYHVLTWGKDGHRKILANAPELSYEAAMHFGYYEAARHCGDDSCATMCDVPFTVDGAVVHALRVIAIE
jgi:hypothetical protein